MKRLHKIAGLFIAVMGTFSSPVFAQQTGTFTLTNSFGNDGIVSISGNGGVSYESVYAGRYLATVNGATVYVYCVDPTHDISGGQSYTADIAQKLTSAAGSLQSTANGDYYNGGLASAMTAADLDPSNIVTVTGTERADEVAYLAGSYLNAGTSVFTGASGSTDLNTNETAVQLAIWDIISDGGYSGGQFLSGSFLLGSSTNATDISAMDYYLELADEYDNVATSNATWIQAPITIGQNGVDNHYQDFVTVAATPEPSIGDFGLALAVAVGLLAFRRLKLAK